MSPHEARANCYMVRYLEDAVDAADDGKPLPLPPLPRPGHLITPSRATRRRLATNERMKLWKRTRRAAAKREEP